MTGERDAIMRGLSLVCLWPIRHAVDYRRVERRVDWYYQREILDNHLVQFINGIPRWAFPHRRTT